MNENPAIRTKIAHFANKYGGIGMHQEKCSEYENTTRTPRFREKVAHMSEKKNKT